MRIAAATLAPKIRISYKCTPFRLPYDLYFVVCKIDTTELLVLCMLVHKRTLVVCLVHRDHTHLSLLESDEALACAEETRTLGTKSLPDAFGVDFLRGGLAKTGNLTTPPPRTSSSSFARFTHNIHEKKKYKDIDPIPSIQIYTEHKAKGQRKCKSQKHCKHKKRKRKNTKPTRSPFEKTNNEQRLYQNKNTPTVRYHRRNDHKTKRTTQIT